jgi:hypothetical protein
VTASDVNDTSSTERWLVWAVIISLLLHVLAFTLWRVGQEKGWWRNMVMPRWAQAITKAMLPVVPKKPVVEDISHSELSFVEIDPALATPAPPKKPMFQSSQNTLAANKEIKVPSPMPNIDGKQEDFLKTVQDARKLSEPKPVPTPVPATPAQPLVAPTPVETAPKKTYVPGDLAMARPADKPTEGKPDATVSEQTQTQPQPQPQQEFSKPKPRTLAEALARNGIPGPQTHQVGGVGNITPDVSLDVQGTPLGNYIHDMVDAVQSHWYQLLEHQSADISGKVILRFRLLPDGRITNMSVVRNEVSDVLSMMCQRAVLDPKFPKWPREMRLELPNDYYDITFTFYYEP